MRRILAGLLFFLTAALHAEWADWSDVDKALLVTSTAALALDWRQSREISEYPRSYRETNPILGNHPSMKAVDTYFLSAMVANYFVADWLGKNRSLYLGLVTAAEGLTLKRNYALGVRIGF